MLTGEYNPLYRFLPQPPVFADLAWAEGQVGTDRTRVSTEAADFIAGVGATRLGVEAVQADQHLVDHLLVAKSLQQAGIVTGQVDHHIGAALHGGLDPEHTQAGVAVDFTGQTRLALPDWLLELQHQLVAPAVIGTLDGIDVQRVECRGQGDLAQCPQRYCQHHVVCLVADGTDLDRYPVLVLGNGRDR
ncbi:hypothetical protein D3C76_1226560 [compost metagenome]